MNVCAAKVRSRRVTGAGLLRECCDSCRLTISVSVLVTGECGTGSSSWQRAIRNSGGESQR